MKELLKFIEEHQGLIASVPGAVESLFETISNILNRGGTDAEKQAKLNALAVEITAIRDAYRANPPELPA